MASELWKSRPHLRAWCARLSDQAARWQPESSLGVDAEPIVRAIERAAGTERSWLVHPCMNRLTLHEMADQRERDVRLVTWVAAHAESPLGTMTIDVPSWRWSRAGYGVEIPAGRHDLGVLVAPDQASGDRTIAVDPTCLSTGFPLDRCWTTPLASGEASLLHATVRETRHALDTLARVLPDCAHWAASVVRVIVPLRAEQPGAWSSGSQPELPGLIQLTGLTGEVMALEGLVHEGAHHHFTMLETSGPLVDPEHRELYESPLRPDRRPLRKVLLAVHALRHIVAFYTDGLATGLLSPEWETRQSHLKSRLDAGLASLMSGRSHYTAHGEELLETMSR